jgi:hypothetical protein
MARRSNRPLSTIPTLALGDDGVLGFAPVAGLGSASARTEPHKKTSEETP